MKPRTARETTIICAAAVLVIALVTVPFELAPDGRGEQHHRLAGEYRRLADMAITAQEHTDLKLGDLSAKLDHLREQNESPQKILKEAE
jgi:hypothetical protein